MTILRPVEQLPGTPQHQSLLAAIISHYANDIRIRALILFGSLAKGTWTSLSDLDLDIVVEDGTVINAVRELEQLCQSLGDLGGPGALVVPDGQEAGDVVLTSLMEFSIRYHPLAITSPNIIDSMSLLAGRIDAETIKAAGLSNRVSTQPSSTILLSQCIRWAVGTDVAIQRNHLWSAIELLHRMRASFMQLFALSRHAQRPLDFFETDANARLQALLGETLPRLDHRTTYQALMTMLDILENTVEFFDDPALRLTAEQQDILNRLRTRVVAANRSV